MKVLQICSARELGGGERHFADLSNSLAGRGHDVFAAVIPGSPLISELYSLPPENISQLRMRNSVDLFAARKLAKVVRASEIDIIHAHVARDYPLAAFASARAGNVPFVLARHVLFPIHKLHRATLARAARIIAVSGAVAESVRRQGIFDAAKIVTINNGVDVRQFTRTGGEAIRPDVLSAVKSPILVGMLGQISPIKGQEIFVRRSAQIARQHADVGFVIAGVDSSPRGENLAAIEGLIAELGLNERCHILGRLEDVSRILPCFDVFVSASSNEAFGLVILEAMASGVPVVATGSAGATEIIEDGVTGRLVPVGDVDALAAEINNLLADPAARESLASQALSAVNDRFTLNGMVDAVEQLYDDVIRERADRDKGRSISRSIT